jgi:AcrR family transcriptional regulator
LAPGDLGPVGGGVVRGAGRHGSVADARGETDGGAGIGSTREDRSIHGAEHPVRRGRRPGRSHTKRLILEAARQLFASAGYDAASIRAVAEEAGVDPALVMYYFSSKQGLLQAAMEWPVDIDEIARGIFEGDPERTGERLARMVCSLWEDEKTRHPLAVILRNAVQNEEAARLASEFVKHVLVGQLVARTDDASAPLRGLLAHSTLVGLVTIRYILGIEPLASASTEEVVQAVGPTLQRYLRGDLGF